MRHCWWRCLVSVKIIGDYKEVLPFALVCPGITNLSLDLYDLSIAFFEL